MADMRPRAMTSTVSPRPLVRRHPAAGWTARRATLMNAPTSRRSSFRRPFRALSDAEVYALPSEALLTYVADAKRHGANDHARTAVHLLLFRDEARMRNRIRARLPSHLERHADTVAEWVLERITRSALLLQFEGQSVGEWVNWFETAIKRQVISFWRSAQGKALEREDMLPAEHEDTYGVRDWIGVDFDDERVAARLDGGDAIRAVLAGMTNADHVRALHAAFWEDRASTDVAKTLGISAANVDQIKSRFRKELRAELERRGVTDDE
jgi:DNA-directed RNA polymerase specialized sigma24 family protein